MKVSKSKLVDYLLVLSVILSSGATMIGSIYIPFFISALALHGKHINYRAIYKALLFCAFLVVNTMCGVGGEILIIDTYIMMMRIVIITIVLCCMSMKKFFTIYLNIMAFLCQMSLVFWIISIIAPAALNAIGYYSNGVYGNILHVYGFSLLGNGFPRNCGVFWEPGVFQGYINLAIALLIFGGFKVNNPKKTLVIFVITLFSTMSTMGYLCLGVILLFASIFNNPNMSSIRTYLKIIGLIGIFVLIIIELQYGFISYKFAGNSSFDSRTEDLRVNLILIKQYPWMGVGLLRDYTSLWEYARTLTNSGYWGDLANSNGLGSCFFKAGIPFTIYYLVNIFRTFYYQCGNTFRFSLVLMIVVLLFFTNEPIMMTPFWLLFLLVSKEDTDWNDVDGERLLEYSW